MIAIDLLTAMALIGSALYLFSIVLVWWRRGYHPQTARMMLLYAIISLLWALEQALWGLGVLDFLAEDFLEWVPLYGLLILAIAFLFLNLTLLHRQRFAWIWGVLGVVWVVGLLVLDLNLLSLPDAPAFRGRSPLDNQIIAFDVLVAGWAFFMGAATVLTMQALRSRRPLGLYTTLSYWAMVLGLSVLGDGLFFSGSWVVGSGLRLAGTLLAGFVISSPHLPEIDHILRRSVSYLVFSVSAVLLYTIIFIVAQFFFRSWSIVSPLGIGLILAFLLVLVLNPLLGRIQKQIAIWVSGEIQDPTYVLRQYSQSITNILDLQLLATVAAGTLSELLEVRRVFLFLVESEKEPDERVYIRLRGVKGMGDTNPEIGRLPEESPLVNFFRNGHSPVTLSEIVYQPRFHGITDEERDWLARLGMEVYVPVYAKNSWIGLLVLGPKGSGAAYTRADMALLSTLADQTAVALENTRLVEGLVRLNNDFRRAYSALDQANRHLERLDKTKSDFISIASHELRTPLTLISGSSQMLIEDQTLGEDPFYSQLLSKIQKGTGRLHEIVDSMLDMAKIDARALELDKEQVSINNLITLVCQDLTKAISDRKQTLEIQDLKPLPHITADATTLHKAFQHLITNAIKYTPDGGKITISGRVLESNLTDFPKGGIEIVIRDTGIGIDPRYHDLIFVKFYQTGELALHSTGKTKFKGGGPGLGLAITRGIIEAHHGKVWVESPGYDEVNCPGSEFHVVLPLRKPSGAILRSEVELPQ